MRTRRRLRSVHWSRVELDLVRDCSTCEGRTPPADNQADPASLLPVSIRPGGDSSGPTILAAFRSAAPWRATPLSLSSTCPAAGRTRPLSCQSRCGPEIATCAAAAPHLQTLWLQAPCCDRAALVDSRIWASTHAPATPSSQLGDGGRQVGPCLCPMSRGLRVQARRHQPCPQVVLWDKRASTRPRAAMAAPRSAGDLSCLQISEDGVARSQPILRTRPPWTAAPDGLSLCGPPSRRRSSTLAGRAAGW